MRMRFMRCILISLVMLSMLVITTAPATAISRLQSNLDPSPLVASPHYKTTHFTVSHSVITSSVTGTHFLYVENGTCTDSIDVYQIGTSLTHVGNYPNDGCPPTPYFGRQSIAVTKANATHSPCLVYIDGHGFVDSFPINTNGSLGAEVSHVADGTTPVDVHISKNGNLVYVSSPG